MDVSALLAQYNSVCSQISFYQLEETRYANLHEQEAALVKEQQGYATKWEDNSNKAEDKLTDDTENAKGLKINGKTIKPIPSWNQSLLVQYCEEYANEKVPKYNPDKLEEYSSKDMDYETMMNSYDVMLEELNAQKEKLQTQLGNATKDTGDIGGGG